MAKIFTKFSAKDFQHCYISDVSDVDCFEDESGEASKKELLEFEEDGELEGLLGKLLEKRDELYVQFSLYPNV